MGDMKVKEYLFSNSVEEVFDLLADLHSLMWRIQGILDYEFKIVEKELNKKISYNYDSYRRRWYKDHGLIFYETPKLTFMLDDLGLRKVSLKIYCKDDKVGRILNDFLKRQDVNKIIVKCKGKKIRIDPYYRSQGFRLDLSRLEINDVQKEVEGLKKLIELKYLSLNGNNIREIAGLDTLVNLKHLDLSQNNIREIAGLDTLVNLKHLDLSQNNIREIAGLDTLVNLGDLNLLQNNIEFVSGLENLTKLYRLNLSYNKIKEIEGLENLTKLFELHINNNRISKMQGLENLEKLKFLSIKENAISEDIIEGNIKFPPYGIIVRAPQRFVRYCKNLEFILDSVKQFEITEIRLILTLRLFAEVFRKIRLSWLRNAIDLDKSKFDKKIFKWAKEFNFKIYGDFLIIEGNRNDYLLYLDNKLKEWEK